MILNYARNIWLFHKIVGIIMVLFGTEYAFVTYPHIFMNIPEYAKNNFYYCLLFIGIGLGLLFKNRWISLFVIIIMSFLSLIFLYVFIFNWFAIQSFILLLIYISILILLINENTIIRGYISHILESRNNVLEKNKSQAETIDRFDGGY